MVSTLRYAVSYQNYGARPASGSSSLPLWKSSQSCRKFQFRSIFTNRKSFQSSRWRHRRRRRLGLPRNRFVRFWNLIDNTAYVLTTFQGPSLLITANAPSPIKTVYSKVMFKNGPSPDCFFVYFRLFEQTLQFLQQIHVKNVYPGYGAGIWTHEHKNKSLLP